MAQSNWEADKMLDVYIYDYLVKRNLQTTAKAFMAEGKVAADPVAIDAPGGFLFEWWSVFWDIFIARTNEKHSEVAAAYIEAQQMKAREQQQQQQQQLQMQRLQLMQQQHPQMMRRDANHPALNGTLNAINSDGVLGTPPASVLAAKMYEERMKHPHSVDSEASQQLLDASRMALLKSGTNHPGQLVQGSPGVPAALQHIQARSQQATEIKSEMGVVQRSLPMDPSSLYMQGNMQAKSALGAAVLNQGVSGLPLKGWPLTGIDQLRPSLGAQVQKPFMSTQNQFQLLPSNQQQQYLAQAQAQTSLGSSPSYGEMDTRRFRALPRGGLNGKDGQPGGNDGSIGSPIQSNSPKGRQDQADYLMKLKVAHMQQASNQQQQELQQQQQLQQNARKRKQPTSSGAANSTGTGNTVGPSPSSPPSTPSAHTPGDGVAMAGNLQHVNNMSKSLMMYGTDGTGGLASSSNQMDDLEHFGDVGSLDDNVESFLSHDDGDARDIFAALKRSPAEHNTESLKGFTFTEAGSNRTSNNKVLCCHFSSDGKLLASAGHEKKVVFWNMDTLQTESTPEEHSLFITDIRFRPNSTHLATSSFDRTVRLWNAAEGGTARVRFQPRIGHLLAAAAENVVSIIDVETDMKTRTLQGHKKVVQSVCWDANGDHLASVSQDSVKVWSLTSGECIHELSSNGNQFHSCIFHPRYPKLLVIGGYQTLELWNMAENQSIPVLAHDGLIAALAESPFTGLVASASHDKSVKIWK
ncbi:transcriptional corepressor LEUNIG_HOMOLOG isoform X3 [Elaeis guineensis]|uniref:Transcriptional corepressor LEUNIG_HOMOLOG isoform X3 n=1 Tax=Elaeis guineensis var. tenera TaxID=51953 RepID=A0A8N4IBE7_ELAGV|nr:transcriptional corepressor LEUNIG_HOMOLOG isoform X3 [Elaeis guineensis]